MMSPAISHIYTYLRPGFSDTENVHFPGFQSQMFLISISGLQPRLSYAGPDRTARTAGSLP